MSSRSWQQGHPVLKLVKPEPRDFPTINEKAQYEERVSEGPVLAFRMSSVISNATKPYSRNTNDDPNGKAKSESNDEDASRG